MFSIFFKTTKTLHCNAVFYSPGKNNATKIKFLLKLMLRLNTKDIYIRNYYIFVLI